MGRLEGAGREPSAHARAHLAAMGEARGNGSTSASNSSTEKAAFRFQTTTGRHIREAVGRRGSRDAADRKRRAAGVDATGSEHVLTRWLYTAFADDCQPPQRCEPAPQQR